MLKLFRVFFGTSLGKIGEAGDMGCWAILGVDVIISLFAAVFAYAFTNELNPVVILPPFLLVITLNVSLYTISYLLFKTYKWESRFPQGIRLIASCIVPNLLLFGIFFHFSIVPNMFLVWNFAFSLMLLLLFRYVIKGIINGLKPQKVSPFHIEDLLGREEIEISTQQIREQLQGKVVMVTGAAGSIGSEIVRQIANFDPALLLLVDEAETPLHNLQLELEDYATGLNYLPVIADVRNIGRLTAIFRTYRPQVVYHAAAYKHVPLMENNPCEAILTNVYGTRNVANHAIRFGCERFVFISTDKAVNPSNIMGASKRVAEIYVQSLAQYVQDRNVETKIVTTRFGNVFDSNGSVIARFRKQIADGGPVTVTHPDITRYFITIPEACRLVLEAGYMGENGKIYVFDMGVSVKIADLAKKMVEAAGYVSGRDIHIQFTGLRPGEKLYEELLNDKELTKPTSHDKIMVADVREYDFREVLKNVHALIEHARLTDENGTVQRMKLLVPEFVSQNSKYEALDGSSYQLSRGDMKE